MTFTTTDARLLALPHKVSQPLASLASAGQIGEAFLELLLDAAELSGDDKRLLGFAAGYLHMAKDGVPVEDVIRMAKRQQRRINLAWSPARWKNERPMRSRSFSEMVEGSLVQSSGFLGTQMRPSFRSDSLINVSLLW